MPYKKGDKVETIHGEKLTVIKQEKVTPLKPGDPGMAGDREIEIPKGDEVRILAKSGDQNVWFPVSKLKKSK